MFSEKVVVLWSGGIDSTGLIQILLEEHVCKIYPIFVKRGQKNEKFEYQAVEHYSKKFKKYENFNTPLIVESKIPALQFKEYSGFEKYYLRNSDLINNAVRYATLEQIDSVLISTYSNDIQDGRREYLEEKEKEVRIGIEIPDFLVFSPFQNNNFPYHDKQSVVKACQNHGLDLSHTRSCYSDKEMKCFNCDGCRNQIKVLK